MSIGPRCPNHLVPLEDCHGGVGICPISGCHFEYQPDEQGTESEIKIDKFGNARTEKKYIVKQIGGTGG